MGAAHDDLTNNYYRQIVLKGGIIITDGIIIVFRTKN